VAALEEQDKCEQICTNSRGLFRPLQTAPEKRRGTGYNYFQLVVPAGASGAHLEGNFTARGGSGNDVQVYLLPENDFVNWQNRHGARSYYSSGRVMVGSFNVNLPNTAGNYYLIFDNRFSMLSPKTVQVNGALTYYQ
jgi:hypothetical protein